MLFYSIITWMKDALSPTVYGIETELSVVAYYPGGGVHEIVGKCHSPDTKLKLYVQPESPGTGTIGAEQFLSGLSSLGIRANKSGMLTNGGRFYQDVSGPEYATSETKTAEEAVHRTFDGDVVLLGVYRYLLEQGILSAFQINRRVVDHNRSSRGIHLNNATSLPSDEEPTDDTIRALAALNVAKGAIFGSGGLLVDERGATNFHHSPRLSLTNWDSALSANYNRRPLVRIPFKPDVGSARVETVTSDALNFAWPIRASLVMTNAMLKLLERGIADFPILRDPVRAAKIVGRFGNSNQIGVVRNGENVGMRPLDLMRMIAETALRQHERHGFLDTESLQVIPEVIDVSDKMTEDPYSVADQVESMARLTAMQRRMETTGVPLDSERMCRFDYYWDMLGGGLAERLKQKNLAGWQGFDNNYSPRITKKRLTEPPQDTRAKLRGDSIKASPLSNASTWDQIDFGDGKPLEPVHPLATERPITGKYHIY